MSKKLKIRFTEDFATKKKGEICEMGYSLAITLIRQDKVAELYTEEKKVKASKEKE